MTVPFSLCVIFSVFPDKILFLKIVDFTRTENIIFLKNNERNVAFAIWKEIILVAQIRNFLSNLTDLVGLTVSEIVIVKRLPVYNKANLLWQHYFCHFLIVNASTNFSIFLVVLQFCYLHCFIVKWLPKLTEMWFVLVRILIFCNIQPF